MITIIINDNDTRVYNADVKHNVNNIIIIIKILKTNTKLIRL